MWCLMYEGDDGVRVRAGLGGMEGRETRRERDWWSHLIAYKTSAQVPEALSGSRWALGWGFGRERTGKFWG